MVSEAEKYDICYKNPSYRLQGARLSRVRMDIESMPAGSTYLDVGCGRGEMVRLARERGVAASGLELVPALCGGDIVCGEVTAIPHDGKFDFVSCYDVVEHLPEDQVDRALDELFRVSRVLLLTTNQKRSVYGDLELHLTRKPREWWDQKIVDRRPAAVQRSTYGVEEWHWRIEV